MLKWVQVWIGLAIPFHAFGNWDLKLSLKNRRGEVGKAKNPGSAVKPQPTRAVLPLSLQPVQGGQKKGQQNEKPAERICNVKPPGTILKIFLSAEKMGGWGNNPNPLERSLKTDGSSRRGLVGSRSSETPAPASITQGPAGWDRSPSAESGAVTRTGVAAPGQDRKPSSHPPLPTAHPWPLPRWPRPDPRMQRRRRTTVWPWMIFAFRFPGWVSAICQEKKKKRKEKP